MCNSRDAQHNWIECLRLRSHEQKCEFLEGVCKQLFLENGVREEFRSRVKCRYKIIGRLIFIKTLQKLFHLNTLIKNELSRLHSYFINYFSLSSFPAVFPRHSSLPSPSFYLWIGQSFANLLSESWDSYLPSLYYRACLLVNLDSLPLSSGQCSGQYRWHTEG